MNNILVLDNRNNLFSKVYLEGQTFNGYSYSKDGVFKTNSDYILSIFKELLYSNKCKFIKEEDDYKVYLDEENNLYHYLKNGKEDIEMFIKYNCVDACLYYGERLSRDISKPFSIRLKELVISASRDVLTIALLTVLGVNSVYSIQNKIITENIPLVFENVEKVTKEEAIDMIDSSQYITDEQKKVLLSEDLLDNVIPYYQDTNMGYFIKSHLQDITISYYSSDTTPLGQRADGYYNRIFDNILNLQQDLSGDYKNAVTCHEFIHLLQNPSCQIYKNICEASAELIASEYYGYKPDAYPKGRENLELLIDIVGPEMVWQFNFSNINPLLNTFRNNLSVLESTELELLLTNDGQSAGADNDRIKELYHILAKNMMSEEEYKEFEFAHSDIILLRTNDLEGKRKYYFNSKLMSDREELYGYSDEEETVYCQKEITKEQYDKYVLEGRDVVEEVYSSQPETDKDNDKFFILSQDQIISMSFDEAKEKKFSISKYYERFKMPISEFRKVENKDEYTYYDFGGGDFKSYFVKNKCKNVLKNSRELQLEESESIVL